MNDADRSRGGGRRAQRPVFRAGLVLGLGLGGFFDGIVFHQILQWHHMLSAYSDPTITADLRTNVFWDGIFHVGTYALTVLGAWFVWWVRRGPGNDPSGMALLGGVVAGWGVFNLVEGTVNHFLLGIHHVWPDGPGGVLVWDVAFLVWGGAFVVLGYVLVSRVPE